jgi:hypothetical protein
VTSVLGLFLVFLFLFTFASCHSLAIQSWWHFVCLFVADVVVLSLLLCPLCFASFSTHTCARCVFCAFSARLWNKVMKVYCSEEESMNIYAICLVILLV